MKTFAQKQKPPASFTKPVFSLSRPSLLSPVERTLFGPSRPLVQAKLTINQPGDKYEQEADRVADEVMRPNSLLGGAISAGSPPNVQKKCAACASGGGLCPKCAEEEKKLQRKPLSSAITPLIQRQSAGLEEDEEEEELLQTKSLSGHISRQTSDLSARIHSSIARGGQPLPEFERAFFKPRFGHDFSRVRIFHDGEAANVARDINARAFTLGQNIFFAPGLYQPASHEGRRLLAHELVHTVQQNPDSNMKFGKSRFNSIAPKTTIQRQTDSEEKSKQIEKPENKVTNRLVPSPAIEVLWKFSVVDPITEAYKVLRRPSRRNIKMAYRMIDKVGWVIADLVDVYHATYGDSGWRSELYHFFLYLLEVQDLLGYHIGINEDKPSIESIRNMLNPSAESDYIEMHYYLELGKELR